MFRFSLSTLLICIFVAAVVLSYCMNLPIEMSDWSVTRWENGKWIYNPPPNYWWTDSSHAVRLPDKTEIIWRLAWFEPLTLALTLFAIHGVRKIWRSIPHKSNGELSDPNSSQSQ
jgi:hypothetical protein